MDGIVVIGGGIAGLSAGYHIGKGCEVFEAGDEPGGLMRTRWIDGFGFDYTGHLLHLKDPYTRGLVLDLLKGNIVEHERKSAIYSKGVYTGYPFQANTYGLPGDVARQCVEGFMDAPGRRGGTAPPENFRDWILHNFGQGIAEHFMLPYNAKLWRYPLEELAVSGIEPYVPVPGVDEIKRGATAEGAKGLGYNARFFYPERGGIYSLVDEMARGVKFLNLGQRAVEIDPAKKTALFSTGYTAWYDGLISTIPLPELIKIMKDVPTEIRDAASALKYVSVYDVSIGVNRPDVIPYHWVYFPEPRFPFYRVGSITNFSRNMSPEGATGLYVEVSHFPDETIPEDKLVGGVMDGLVECGILSPGDDVPVKDVADIRYAYVTPDGHMERALPVIKKYLDSVGIISAGRYAGWEYSSMEDAILEGRDAAELAMDRI
ncbi:MAG TPA: FAD-dependent oxidoreductase [Nitrospirota bacterium]|jgi:protoporphyrinogen oxidase